MPKEQAPPGYEKIKPDYYLELLQRMNHKSKYSILTPIDVAMWEEDVILDTDVSNRALYNEVFIESDIMPGLRAFVMQIALIGHNMLLFLFLFVLFDAGLDKVLGFPALPIMYSIMLLVVIFLLFLKSDKIRFNRQTQMIYMSDGKSSIAFPWREVQGVLVDEFGVDGRNDILLTLPYQVEGLLDDAIHYDPFNFSGAFDESDVYSTISSIRRYEFIRRYMENGLEAIQPTVDNPRVASGSSIKPPDVIKYLAMVINLFTLKPLVDKWFIHRAAKMKWPADIEALCQPGADLTGIDTSVVKSRPNLFYRVDGGRVTGYVDAEGHGPHQLPQDILELYEDPFKQD